MPVVRKHRAPNGALRRSWRATRSTSKTCQKAPSAKRCIKTVPQALVGVCLTCVVRKHRAPKGALRPHPSAKSVRSRLRSQKAPSAKRCIKTAATSPVRPSNSMCQKAPSAKRCIKTLDEPAVKPEILDVRKHRAPKGALRQNPSPLSELHTPDSQKAPSAKRALRI